MKKEDGITVFEAASALSLFRQYKTYAYVDTFLKGVKSDTDVLMCANNIKETHGHFFLVYEYFGLRQRRLRFRYGSYDMFLQQKRHYYYFKSYEHFLECAEEDELVRFVLKCTTISKETFEYAERYMGMQIPFCLDVGKYMALCDEGTVLRPKVIENVVAALYEDQMIMDRAVAESKGRGSEKGDLK